MNRTLAAVAALVLLALPAAVRAEQPQPGPWKYGMVAGLNLSQSAFSDNWSGGDKGNINWVLNLDADAKRQVSPSLFWSNQLQLAYGQTSTQSPDGSGGKSWSTPDKTTDLVQFESVGRWTLGKLVDPYLAVRLDSQFSDDSSPIGQLRFNPVKLTETAGIAHAFRQTEQEEIISRAGFGLRQSFARSFTDATGDATESFHTSDGGLEFQTDAKLLLAQERVLYTGKLQVFLPLFFDKSSDLEDFDTLAQSTYPGREAIADFWKAPDVNFQNTFTSEITSWLNVNLYVQWVYDKFDAATNVGAVDAASLDAAIAKVDAATRKSGQFKQTLGIGLTYRFL
ncbi:DUF3078 domain-containing protein [bacterium]|nr:DUF3078 domain-containing protein [bacterium]